MPLSTMEIIKVFCPKDIYRIETCSESTHPWAFEVALKTIIVLGVGKSIGQ